MPIASFAIPIALRAAIVLLLLLLLSGCGPLSLAKQRTERVEPHVVTVARSQGATDINNSCSPPSTVAPPAPEFWWLEVPPGQAPKLAGQGVVGFDIWRNTTDRCEEFRHDLYRTEFAYDLAGLRAFKGMVTKAELTLSAAVLPAPRSGSRCQAMSGAGGALFLLPPGTLMPPTVFLRLPPPQPFRTGAQLFAMRFPWAAGPLVNGASTGADGDGRATFTVELSSRLNAALGRGDPALSFALSGADEAFPLAPPPASFDCRTIYQIGPLQVTHL